MKTSTHAHTCMFFFSVQNIIGLYIISIAGSVMVEFILERLTVRLRPSGTEGRRAEENRE